MKNLLVFGALVVGAGLFAGTTSTAKADCNYGYSGPYYGGYGGGGYGSGFGTSAYYYGAYAPIGYGGYRPYYSPGINVNFGYAPRYYGYRGGYAGHRVGYGGGHYHGRRGRW